MKNRIGKSGACPQPRPSRWGDVFRQYVRDSAHVAGAGESFYITERHVRPLRPRPPRVTQHHRRTRSHGIWTMMQREEIVIGRSSFCSPGAMNEIHSDSEFADNDIYDVST
ncbi:hypothetical protein EVAR_53797_1 [Eumeta japonica]|uniref:Uncharacterized protein n=1 Tax=Eumeta variegata TaxID=151549 RepID=A0A4C1XV75_EUMVA|nr:hypothetical protein EVAR_53797_1 [Eumeta japonica]